VANPDGVHGGVAELRVDGQLVPVPPGACATVPLRDDGLQHRVEARLGSRAAR